MKDAVSVVVWLLQYGFFGPANFVTWLYELVFTKRVPFIMYYRLDYVFVDNCIIIGSTLFWLFVLRWYFQGPLRQNARNSTQFNHNVLRMKSSDRRR